MKRKMWWEGHINISNKFVEEGLYNSLFCFLPKKTKTRRCRHITGPALRFKRPLKFVHATGASLCALLRPSAREEDFVEFVGPECSG